jgi:hypothetical protein
MSDEDLDVSPGDEALLNSANLLAASVLAANQSSQGCPSTFDTNGKIHSCQLKPDHVSQPHALHLSICLKDECVRERFLLSGEIRPIHHVWPVAKVIP